MSKVTEVKYTCSKCGAEDTVKLYPDESVPVTINCWKCRSGYGKDIAEMVATGAGMFPPKDMTIRRSR